MPRVFYHEYYGYLCIVVLTAEQRLSYWQSGTQGMHDNIYCYIKCSFSPTTLA